MSIDSPHALRVEVARLTKERDEARKETVRLGDACLAWGARVDEMAADLAAARRDLQDADRLFLGTLAGIVTAIPGDPEQIDAWLRERVAHAKYQYNEQRKGRAAATAPALGEETPT